MIVGRIRLVLAAVAWPPGDDPARRAGGSPRFGRGAPGEAGRGRASRVGSSLPSRPPPWAVQLHGPSPGNPALSRTGLGRVLPPRPCLGCDEGEVVSVDDRGRDMAIDHVDVIDWARSGYFTAMTSTARMSGSRASRSGPTWLSARGISPPRWAWRASSTSNVSKMP